MTASFALTFYSTRGRVDRNSQLKQGLKEIMSRPAPVNEERQLSTYPHTCAITTRWSDNDQYGHLNNSVYYFLFDAIVNTYLVRRCGMEPLSRTGPIGLVVGSGCRYHGPLSFPDPLQGSMKVVALGRSAVTYHLAVSTADATAAAATGWFTHVFVDPTSRRPVPIPPHYRAGFLEIATDSVRKGEEKAKL
ncbi:Thioesterase family protein [Taphrina deformans PYCC 5710]|uniref:Thioesterase family protein n=1 Tax=Taphrina deformans (strain PYCC 5710 / ATCC 11124 / CBS 356.35 / IMI 108563 / JCM 9778 / NBRC 8474) TaxID=1097556 RepID=R4X6R0_TAPDE|nr:Thioesterase family protein [Taphrina deformans PYCC 5710]|eukprot:CCG80601.1 Thioesterase family protein [Taphrina deformans PYCC 5710]